MLGLTQAEYEGLSKEEKEAANKKAAETYFAAGADYVVQDIRGVLELVSC